MFYVTLWRVRWVAFRYCGETETAGQWRGLLGILRRDGRPSC
jgi:hypothetical protein